MQKQPLSFDQLLAAVYQLCQDVSELKRLIAQQHPGPATSPDEETPVNLKEAARILGIAEQTVYQNIKKIPSKKRFGRLYFYPSDLRAYLNEGKGTGA